MVGWVVSEPVGVRIGVMREVVLVELAICCMVFCGGEVVGSRWTRRTSRLALQGVKTSGSSHVRRQRRPNAEARWQGMK
jgi:hypothetical protein